MASASAVLPCSTISAASTSRLLTSRLWGRASTCPLSGYPDCPTPSMARRRASQTLPRRLRPLGPPRALPRGGRGFLVRCGWDVLRGRSARFSWGACRAVDLNNLHKLEARVLAEAQRRARQARATRLLASALAPPRRWPPTTVPARPWWRTAGSERTKPKKAIRCPGCLRRSAGWSWRWT